MIERFVTTVRTGRSLLDYGPSKTLTIWGTANDPADLARLLETRPHLETLCRGTVSITNQNEWPTDRMLHLVIGSSTVGMTIEGDVNLNKALDRVKKQSHTKQKEAARLQGRLVSPDFTAKASSDVVQESQERLARLTAELSLLSNSERQLLAMVS